MDLQKKKEFYCLWLSNIDGVSARYANLLMESLGGAQNVWLASGSEIVEAGFSQAIAASVRKAKSASFLDKIALLCETLEKQNIRVLCLDADEYPDSLKRICGAPLVLYMKGEMPSADLLHIGVIGTRRCTEYGADAAHYFSRGIVKGGAVVVSGMAAGIDSIAHKGAIGGGGKTIAVLGSGIDICYPASNRALMEQIIENGCVVSEYPPGTKPLPGNFPARNRIISGLCKAILVVEAGVKSGTLITVDYALEQGREVFAIPGNVTSQTSSGTNLLIKQGASLVTSAKDIFEELDRLNIEYKLTKEHGLIEEEVAVMEQESSLTDDEAVIYSHIGTSPERIEAILEKTGCSIPILSYALTCLEIKGLVRKLPGNRCVRSI